MDIGHMGAILYNPGHALRRMVWPIASTWIATMPSYRWGTGRDGQGCGTIFVLLLGGGKC